MLIKAGKSLSSLKVAGNGSPLNRFEERSSDTKLVILVSISGTFPVIAFPARDREVRLDNIPIDDGIFLLKRLPFISKDVNLEK